LPPAVYDALREAKKRSLPSSPRTQFELQCDRGVAVAGPGGRSRKRGAYFTYFLLEPLLHARSSNPTLQSNPGERRLRTTFFTSPQSKPPSQDVLEWVLSGVAPGRRSLGGTTARIFLGPLPLPQMTTRRPLAGSRAQKNPRSRSALLSSIERRLKKNNYLKNPPIKKYKPNNKPQLQKKKKIKKPYKKNPPFFGGFGQPS